MFHCSVSFLVPEGASRTACTEYVKNAVMDRMMEMSADTPMSRLHVDTVVIYDNAIVTRSD